ncbi:MAG: phage tail sheath C-terminal domain-containing protein [Bacteroidota bacterium]
MITQTPGVYIIEQNTTPGSVAGVSTAIPVFIGYTEKDHASDEVITSMRDYRRFFGADYVPDFTVTATKEIKPDRRFMLGPVMEMYFKNGGGPCHVISIETFDKFNELTVIADFNAAIAKVDNLDAVTLVLIPDLHMQYTATGGNLESLSDADFATLANGLISKCASLVNKFAILDFKNMTHEVADFRTLVGTSSGADMKHAAAYYPWLNNPIEVSVAYDRLTYTHSSTIAGKIDAVKADITLLDTTEFPGLVTNTDLKARLDTLVDEVLAQTTAAGKKSKSTALVKFLLTMVKKLVTLEGKLAAASEITTEFAELKGVGTPLHLAISKLYRLVEVYKTNFNSLAATYFIDQPDWQTFVAPSTETIVNLQANTAYDPTGQFAHVTFAENVRDGVYFDYSVIFSAIAGLYSKAKFKRTQYEIQLFTSDSDYVEIKEKITQYMQALPSQGAVAGIYCKNDRDRGVWKSPANMVLQGGEYPLVAVSNREQDGMNVDPNTGKSINVLRKFTGRGTLVWGGRTLAGNDNEWRYISVRRFFSFVEESVSKSLKSLVFEPNNANTWIKIKAMVTSFLVKQWEAGALSGGTIKEAFFVEVGEYTSTGDPLTPANDINAGIVNVQIGMAVNRPAEFIILKLSHEVN